MTTHLKAAEALKQELRRGAVVLAVLELLEQEHYGYSLRDRLASRGLEVSEGTLYPLLRRLESQGLLVSQWRLGQGRPRRYYLVSGVGRETRTELRFEWQHLIESLQKAQET